MTIEALASDIRQIERAVGIGVTAMAIGYHRFLAVRMSMTVRAFGKRIFVFNHAWRIGMINLVAEGTFLLMTMPFTLQELEYPYMALRALFHSQWLNVLIEERRPGRYFFDLGGHVNTVQLPGLGQWAHYGTGE